MSKAILVMDMPETCGDCWLCASGLAGRRCYGKEGDAMVVGEDARHPDCPLIPAIGYVQPVGHVVSWEDEE